MRELKQQEKYKTMLKRKNKEKKIYKDKNASLQFEKQKLYRALLNREKEIEKLNNIINELEKYIHNDFIDDFYNENITCNLIVYKMEYMIKELKGSENNDNK